MYRDIFNNFKVSKSKQINLQSSIIEITARTEKLENQ